jgi:hypothetical protein
MGSTPPIANANQIALLGARSAATPREQINEARVPLIAGSEAISLPQSALGLNPLHTSNFAWRGSRDADEPLRPSALCLVGLEYLVSVGGGCLNGGGLSAL